MVVSNFFALGLEYDKAQEYKKAAESYMQAAVQGHVRAQNNLGVMYNYGQGVEQSHDEAMKWFMKAAEQGHARAQNNLGVMYNHGQGVEQSHDEAMKWFMKAAEQGHAKAQHNLERMRNVVNKKENSKKRGREEDESGEKKRSRNDEKEVDAAPDVKTVFFQCGEAAMGALGLHGDIVKILRGDTDAHKSALDLLCMLAQN